MARTIAADYLWEPGKHPAKPLCVFFGKEMFLKTLAMRHLRSEVLTEEDAEFLFSRLDGDNVRWTGIASELSTIAMFGSGRRLVLVDDADSFITKNRPELEKYCDKPAKSGVLVLLAQEFPSNTNLYKKADSMGLIVDCSPLAAKNIPQWLIRWAKQRHHISLDSTAANLLVEFVGTELGLLDQEMAKLALIAGPKETVTASIVEKNVGSWRTRSTFEMFDFALAGQTGKAIRELDKLLIAGADPIETLSQIAYSIRKFAAACQLILDAETDGKKRMPVSSALEQVGVNRYFLQKSETQLKSLGRHRGQKLLSWLLAIDADLKGASRSEPRLLLEMLIVRLSSPAMKTL